MCRSLAIEMFLLCFMFLLPIFTLGSPVQHIGCQDINGRNICKIETSEALNISTTNASTRASKESKLMDDFSVDSYDEGKKKKDDDRTWRINRKALIPILVGMAVKALALIPLALGALVIMGSIAIFISKISMTITGLMFLKRFFSTDSSSGGFFGLNPLAFPHSTIAQQDHYRGGQSANHLNYGHGRGDEDNVLQRILSYEKATPSQK